MTSERITGRASIIEKAFVECFVDFKDNPYVDSVKLSDTKLQWAAAKKQFASIIEKEGISKDDLVSWITQKAFTITDDNDEAHKNDNVWDRSRIMA